MFHVKRRFLWAVAMAPFLLVAAACGGTGGPDGWAAPAESGEHILLASGSGNLEAFTSQGGLVWSFPTKQAEDSVGEDIDIEAIYGNVVVADENAYFSGFDHFLYALDTSEAQPLLRWRFESDGDLVGGPLLNDDTIVFGSADHRVYFLDAETGDELARFSTEERIWSTPAFDQDVFYVSSMDSRLYALTLDDGVSQVWDEPFDARGALAASPVVDDGVIYLGSYDSRAYAISATDGAELWSFNTGNWVWADATVGEELVYFANLDGRVLALERESGDLLWDYRTGDAIRARPALVDDILVVANREGRLVGLDAENGDELWVSEEIVGSDVLSDPALINGSLYVRTEAGDLFRVDPEDGSAERIVGEGDQ
jgi:eukaryotic-like serine/threonine-protein kinase